MFAKLRQNYRLSNLLVRIGFVLAYMLYSWQDCITSAKLAVKQLGGTLAVNFNSSAIITVALTSSFLIGTVLMFLVPFVVGLFLNMSRFYNIPRAEYSLLAELFCIFYYIVCGLFGLINLITPNLAVWVGTLVRFLASTGCVIWFYLITSNLYFNDVTKPYYFRNLAIVYFVCAIAFGVLL